MLQTKIIFISFKWVHNESFPPTPAQASIRTVFGITATLGLEERQLDVDMVYLEPEVEEIYIELWETCLKT